MVARPVRVSFAFDLDRQILVRLERAKVLPVDGPPGLEVDDADTWKQRTAEIAIRYQLVQMALEYLQMLGQVALLRHTTVTLVERFGGRFLEQGRELARIVQYRDGVATEGIVSVLHDRRAGALLAHGVQAVQTTWAVKRLRATSPD
uniref:Uncharacterized protein n=1 Tax=Anopheles merus TaxID=30066 RepID=A0A182URM6_ANOME